ncbi:MAG: hypothetical protein L0G99_08655 [Propionibacteriales bacterium]|nr:hypothetical protein [Propionibacteriales bacterium]
MSASVDLLPLVLRRTPAALPVLGAAAVTMSGLLFMVLALFGAWTVALPILVALTVWPTFGALVAVAVDLCRGEDPTVVGWFTDLTRRFGSRVAIGLAWAVPASFTALNVDLAGASGVTAVGLAAVAGAVLTVLGLGWATTALVVDLVPGLGWRCAASIAVRKVHVLIGVATLAGVAWWLSGLISPGVGILVLIPIALAAASGILNGYLVPVEPPDQIWVLPPEKCVPINPSSPLPSSTPQGAQHG